MTKPPPLPAPKTPPPLPPVQKVNKSGSFKFVFIIILGVTLLLAFNWFILSHDAETGSSSPIETTDSSERSDDKAAKSSPSFDAGYEYGFRVGQSRHDNKEPSFDQQRLSMMSAMHASSYIENEKNGSSGEYQSGFQSGYQDGFIGVGRGGVQQKPLPELPIKIARIPKVLIVSLGNLNRSSDSPYDELYDIVSENPSKDFFVITASEVASKHLTYHKKLIYDADEKMLLKLERTALPFNDNSYDWVIVFDLEANQLEEDRLWEDPQLRMKRSKHKKAYGSIPLIYLKNKAITTWP